MAQSYPKEWERGAGLPGGEVLSENMTMLKMCRELGFHIEESPNDPHIRVVKLSLDADT
jgi:hypothetical protein